MTLQPGMTAVAEKIRFFGLSRVSGRAILRQSNPDFSCSGSFYLPGNSGPSPFSEAALRRFRMIKPSVVAMLFMVVSTVMAAIVQPVRKPRPQRFPCDAIAMADHECPAHIPLSRPGNREKKALFNHPGTRTGLMRSLPEPSTFVMLVIGCILAARFQTRRRN